MIVDPISPGLHFSASPPPPPAHRSWRRSFETLQGHLLQYLISGPRHLSNTFNTSWAFPPLWKNCPQTFLIAQQQSRIRVRTTFKFISIYVHLFSLCSLSLFSEFRKHVRCWQAEVTWANLLHDILSYLIRRKNGTEAERPVPSLRMFKSWRPVLLWGNAQRDLNSSDVLTDLGRLWHLLLCHHRHFKMKRRARIWKITPVYMNE